MKEKKKLSEGTRIWYNFVYGVYKREHKSIREAKYFLYTFVCPWRTTKEIEKEVLKAILYKEKGIF